MTVNEMRMCIAIILLESVQDDRIFNHIFKDIEVAISISLTQFNVRFAACFPYLFIIKIHYFSIVSANKNELDQIY